MDEQKELKKNDTSKKKTVSQVVCILIALLAVILGGLAGYAYGTNTAKADTEAEYQQKASSLEDDLDSAKSSVTAQSEADQQSIESLQSENTALKQTIEGLNKQIADLEKQLEEANNSPGN